MKQQAKKKWIFDSLEILSFGGGGEKNKTGQKTWCRREPEFNNH